MRDQGYGQLLRSVGALHSCSLQPDVAPLDPHAKKSRFLDKIRWPSPHRTLTKANTEEYHEGTVLEAQTIAHATATHSLLIEVVSKIIADRA